jgi:Rap1a immunity proteins
LRYITAMIVVLMLATPAKAGEAFMSVAKLLPYCESNDVTILNFCAGYLSAVADALDNQRKLNKGGPCITTPAVTVRALRDVVVPFLRSHIHDNGEETAIVYATIAIGRTWCPGG